MCDDVVTWPRSITMACDCPEWFTGLRASSARSIRSPLQTVCIRRIMLVERCSAVVVNILYYPSNAVASPSCLSTPPTPRPTGEWGRIEYRRHQYGTPCSLSEYAATDSANPKREQRDSGLIACHSFDPFGIPSCSVRRSLLAGGPPLPMYPLEGRGHQWLDAVEAGSYHRRARKVLIGGVVGANNNCCQARARCCA